MSAATFAATGTVLIAKSTLVCPAGTLTEAGILTAVLSDANVTVMPAAGAGPFNRMRPVTGVPPITVEGNATTDAKCWTTAREFVRENPRKQRESHPMCRSAGVSSRSKMWCWFVQPEPLRMAGP